MSAIFNFMVENEDVSVRFACACHARRIGEFVRNLRLDLRIPEDSVRKICRFTAGGSPLLFRFDDECIEGRDVRHEAVFFENTEYLVVVRGRAGVPLRNAALSINGRKRSDGEAGDTLVFADGGLFGSLNFHNQVGLVDFEFSYVSDIGCQSGSLIFTTEVFSYKLDYRSDVKAIVADIEKEYALLSSSFLKDTYLSARHRAGESCSLVWWQIFKSCYDEIVRAARLIIARPKRRLRGAATFERAERIAFLPPCLESEYSVFRGSPGHSYRAEVSVSTHDTVENRFLKYALEEMSRRFAMVKGNIMTAMHWDDPSRVDNSLRDMENGLAALTHDPFFRGIGRFRGFVQDNLVLKQASGYRVIFAKWVELMQGYELGEGVRKLEVKDICDLYEIWCFIKVKNIVGETLRDLKREHRVVADGKVIGKDFIPQLAYGGGASFVNADGVEFASLCYNARFGVAHRGARAPIAGTSSFTTAQRPDIVLRLSKSGDDGMKYTYLFDAKYRIDDTPTPIGDDVPPEDAVNQMHRYRDAIYYTEQGEDRRHLKKEVIAGYVLFPGHVNPKSWETTTDEYPLGKSGRLVGIGAFPLRPGETERALRLQIRRWLEDDGGRELLLEQSIPQKGLEYTDEPIVKGTFFLSSTDAMVNDNDDDVQSGRAKIFVSGFATIMSGIDLQKIKYFAPVRNHVVKGFYQVLRVGVVDKGDILAMRQSERPGSKYKGFGCPLRIELRLGEFRLFERQFLYGIDANASRGVVLTSEDVKSRLIG